MKCFISHLDYIEKLENELINKENKINKLIYLLILFILLYT